MHALLKKDYIIFVVIMIVMTGVTLIWLDRNTIKEYRDYQQRIGIQSSLGAAQQVSIFIEEQTRLVRLFADEYIDLINAVKNDPENEDKYSKLSDKIKEYFPTYFAFTISDLNGNPYIVDYDGFILQTCNDDLIEFSEKNYYSPYIHPNTEGYHFDVMTRYGDDKENPDGIFFVSFHADIIGEILKSLETPQHSLMLIYPEKGNLIEVIAGGARNIWDRFDYRLSDVEISRILIRKQVAGTRWQAIDMHDEGLFSSFERNNYIRSLMIFFAFLVVGVLLVIRLFVEEKKRTAAQQQRETLLSYITHEFRTPVTAIMSALGILNSKKMSASLPNEKKQSLIWTALNNTRRLRKLVDDFLDLKNIESKSFTLNIEKINILGIVKTAIDNNEMYGVQFGVNYAFSSNHKEILVAADAFRIEQVITNLLSNATKYGKRNDSVEVTVEKQDSLVRVNVTDHGFGIPDNFKPYIFKQYALANSTDKSIVRSSGIGLNLAQTIIEKHGGTIGFNTETGVGTTFYFTLPVSV